MEFKLFDFGPALAHARITCKLFIITLDLH